MKIGTTSRSASVCIAAQRFPNGFASTADTGAVYYSNAATTGEAGWDGQYHRVSYIKSEATTSVAAGNCATLAETAPVAKAAT